MTIETLDLAAVPKYLQPVVEELFIASSILEDDGEFATPENLTKTANAILDAIEQHDILTRRREATLCSLCHAEIFINAKFGN